MPVRKIPHLKGGETEKLTQVYWNIHAVVWNKKSTDEDVFLCKQQYVSKLNDDELAYLYWEINYSNARNCREALELMKQYLISEYMNRLKMKGDSDERN